MEKSERMPWDEFWFLLAINYSIRATCDRLRTACIIVKDKELVSAGYNGSPSGLPHCDDVGHLIINDHCERTLHAETNAILHADRSRLVGAEAYIIGTPCIRCFMMLVSSGVNKINYLGEHKNSMGKDYIQEIASKKDVKLVQYDFDPEALIHKSIEMLSRTGGILDRYKSVRKEK